MMVIVLQAGQLLAEQPDVMVVEQRDGADDHARRLLGNLVDEVGPDQVAERLRSIRVSSARDQVVEFLEQLRVDRHADAAELTHALMVATPTRS